MSNKHILITPKKHAYTSHPNYFTKGKVYKAVHNGNTYRYVANKGLELLYSGVGKDYYMIVAQLKPVIGGKLL